MNPETFRALSATPTTSVSSMSKPFEKPRASFQDVAFFPGNSPDKSKVYQGLKDLKKLAFDLNEMISINNENLNASFKEDKLVEYLEHINHSEKKFEGELEKIDVKIDKLNGDFEKKFDSAMLKLEKHDSQMNQLELDLKQKLNEMEKRVLVKLDSKSNEIILSLDKQFKEFTSKLNQTFEIFLLNLDKN